MKTAASKVKKTIAGLLILLVITTGFSQVSVTTKKGHKSVTINKNGLNSFEIEHEGTITISDDDKDITAISSGGYVEISKTSFGNKRKIRIEPSGSDLKKEYYVGRQKVEWEPEGRKWLAEVLLEVIRSTSFGAKSRVDRFYKNGGVAAVFQEINLINSDYVKSIYASLLLEKDGLSNADLVKIVRGVAEEIDSDYYLSNILKDNGRKLLKNEETSMAYFKAIENIGSDYYASVVLKEALEDGMFSEKQAEAIVNAAKSIGSDYYMSSVFTEVMHNEDVSDEVILSIIKTTNEIDSDHYQSQVLMEIVERDRLSSDIYAALIHAAGNISSDHYMNEIFKKVLDNEISTAEMTQLVTVVSNNMSSDHYITEIFKELVRGQKMTDELINKLSVLIKEMSSSHYATEVLKQLADQDLSEKQIIVLLDATSSIDSDHYLTVALLEFANKARNGSSDLKDAYRKAAKSISSDTYYGRAIKAID